MAEDFRDIQCQQRQFNNGNNPPPPPSPSPRAQQRQDGGGGGGAAVAAVVAMQHKYIAVRRRRRASDERGSGGGGSGGGNGSSEVDRRDCTLRCMIDADEEDEEPVILGKVIDGTRCDMRRYEDLASSSSSVAGPDGVCINNTCVVSGSFHYY